MISKDLDRRNPSLDSALEKNNAHGRYITTEYGTAGCVDPDKGAIGRAIASLIPGDMTDNWDGPGR